MPHTCVVVGCTNRSDPAVKRGFYRFPKVRVHEGSQTEELSRRRRETWIARLNRKDFVPTDYSKVCSDHFTQGKPADLYQPAHPDWAPSLKLNGVSRRLEKREKRLAAMALLNLSRSEVETVETDISPRSSPVPVDESTPESREVSPPDEPSTAPGAGDGDAVSCSLRGATVTGWPRLMTEDSGLEEKLLQKTITEESFRGDAKMVQFYTGLPSFFTLTAVFEFVQPHILDSRRINLSKFEKLVLTLMKLRLNVSLHDLAYRFKTSQATVSKVFLGVVDALHARLRTFIYWPQREQLRQTTPATFRRCFGERVVVVVDCLEIFIQRTSRDAARARRWSLDRHHNTVKFLIGMTPRGSISFLSKAVGGRASDKHVTETSGLLEKLLPGDVVVTHGGFDVAGSAGATCAELKATEGKLELSAFEAESAQTVGHVRTHVERLIGLARNKYAILSETLPINYLINDAGDPTVEKVVAVCCALVNFCPAVVPFD